VHALPVLNFVYMESYTRYSFESGGFHSTNVFEIQLCCYVKY
jgi:hypothetical protein